MADAVAVGCADQCADWVVLVLALLVQTLAWSDELVWSACRLRLAFGDLDIIAIGSCNTHVLGVAIPAHDALAFRSRCAY